MKITFLGTACGVPQSDRYCSATMVECGGRTYLIDAGAPVVELMRRQDKTPEQLSAVFITHVHGDHIDGLPALINIMNWYYKDADPTVFIPEEGYIEPLFGWLSLLSCGEDIRPMKILGVSEGVIYNDGVLEVSAIRTRHIKDGKRPSYAYMLRSLCEGDEKRVLFTGDLSHSCDDYPSVAFESDFDLIVCEAAHFDALERISVFEKSRTELFLINHAGMRIVRDGVEKLLEFCSRLPFEARVVNDGEVYSI